MRNFWLTAFLIGGLLSSCSSQNSVVINGEEQELSDGVYAHMNTNMGDILIKLEEEKAPLTTANFVALAEGNHPEVAEQFKGKPFYDGLIFHRVIPQFMIQGGDPEGTGMGGPGYQFEQETSKDLSHNKGVISMANSGPNTNGSQFFITVAHTAHLDGGYNVFGKVVAGQDVADKISEVERNRQDRPNTDVVINTVKIIRKGSAKDYDAPKAWNEAKEAMVAAKAEEEAAAKKQVEELTAGMEQTSTGLYYEVLTEGTGPKPEPGQMVLMNYSGWLPDGTLFDSSIESVAKEGGRFNPGRKYEPFAVAAGRNAPVIQGWREALVRMKVGDKWKLVIPPNLGYGSRGAGNLIPPDSWLVFEVEMVSIKEAGSESAK